MDTHKTLFFMFLEEKYLVARGTAVLQEKLQKHYEQLLSKAAHPNPISPSKYSLDFLLPDSEWFNPPSHTIKILEMAESMVGEVLLIWVIFDIFTISGLKLC